MRSIALISLLTVAVGASAAAASAPPHVPDSAIVDGSLQHHLDAARKSWKAAELRSYRYEILQSCFCPQQKTRLVVVRNVRPSRFPQGLSSVATVPRLHRLIQRAIDDGVASLSVNYGKRGVPRTISVDGVVNIADDEFAYSVSRFAPLPRRTHE